jgi:hypothetical protein
MMETGVISNAKTLMRFCVRKGDAEKTCGARGPGNCDACPISGVCTEAPKRSNHEDAKSAKVPLTEAGFTRGDNRD